MDRPSTPRIRFGGLPLRPDGAGLSTYISEFFRAFDELRPDLGATALVQDDVVDRLPASIRPVRRPVASGAVRAAFSSAPTRPLDLYHSLDVDLPVAGPRLTAATVHDLSVWDTPWAMSAFRARAERGLLRSSIGRADIVIAVSRFTADRIAEILGRHDVVVAPLAPAGWARPAGEQEIASVRRRYGLPERFVLQVATVEPRKQPALVAEAAERAGLPLVLAGSGSTGPDVPAGVRGLGFVPTEDLPALYGAATVTTYASMYEGYGLPPVEAMACGGAVVASRVGGLPEAVDTGAILLDSTDPATWADAIGDLAAGDAAAGLRRRAVLDAQRWSWEDHVRTCLAAYRNAGLTV